MPNTKIIEININKPVWAMSRGNRYFVNIREELLLRAKRMGRMLKISTMGVSMTCSPDYWLENSDRRFQIFNKPNEPMILRGGFVEQQQGQKLF